MRHTLRSMILLVSSLLIAGVMSTAESRGQRASDSPVVMISKVLLLMEVEQSSARRASLADRLSRIVETAHPLDFNPGLIDAIASLLEDDEKLVRRAAARALRHIGPPARRAIPALNEALNKEMPGQFIVPSGGAAADMVAALVSINGMMGIRE